MARPSRTSFLLAVLAALCLFAFASGSSEGLEERSQPTGSQRYIVVFDASHRVSSSELAALSDLTSLGVRVVHKLPLLNALVVSVPQEAVQDMEEKGKGKGKKGVMAVLEELEGVDYVEEDKEMHIV